MSPELQTIITLAISAGTYFWGYYYGRSMGIEMAMIYFERTGQIKIEYEDEDDE